MQRRTYRFFLLVSLVSFLAFNIAACSGGKHPSAEAVENFIRALVEKNEAQYTTLTCADYEMDALIEYDAFSLVKTRLGELDCQATTSGKDTATVSCQGQIIATYGNEDQIFDLNERQYNVVEQGGTWLVCGY